MPSLWKWVKPVLCKFVYSIGFPDYEICNGTHVCILKKVRNWFILWKLNLICSIKPSQLPQIFSLMYDLSGKRAFIAGIADDNGYGWAIAKALAAAGAEILVGTWVPVCWSDLALHIILEAFVNQLSHGELYLWQALNIFETSLRRGKFDESRKSVL